MRMKTGSFREFKDDTLAVARRERRVDSREPKIWCEPTEVRDNTPISQTTSLERGKVVPNE